jgi:hypothetical protein
MATATGMGRERISAKATMMTMTTAPLVMRIILAMTTEITEVTEGAEVTAAAAEEISSIR